jgi:hypothetical protein
MGLKNKILGIFLLPFSFGFLISFAHELRSIKTVGLGETAFFVGVLGYPIFHYFFIKPRFLSTLAHEITHVLWGTAFRARVKDLRVRRGSGFVNLSKSNFIIRLAPYFFPLFTILLLLAAFFLRPDYLIWVFFLVGFTLSFHIISTLESLSVWQPDILKTGILFSIPIITLSNLIVIVLVLEFISPENIHVKKYFVRGIVETLNLVSKMV